MGVLTGDNPAEVHIGAYSNEYEAAKLLKRLYGAKGGEGVVSALNALFEPVEVAQTGDFVLAKGIEDKPAVGILNGELITAQGVNGLVSSPAQKPLSGWRVRKVN